MNIIEAEDVVKGLPDRELFQEAQYPSGRIPQFLAVSEVQRRQDMRQRFQAQQQQPQQTVKDQILQGAMGGGQPQMPPQHPPMPQAPAAMGAPPPPQAQMYRGGIARMSAGGITKGGIVYMQEGRAVPDATEQLRKLQQLRRVAIQRGDQSTARAIEQQISALQIPGASATLGQTVPNRAAAAAPVSPVATVAAPVDPAQQRAGLESRLRMLRERNARPEQIANLERQISGLSAPAPSVAQAAPAVAAQAAPPRGPVSPGIPAAGAALSTGQAQSAPASNPMGYLTGLLKPYERPAEVQAAIDMTRRMADEGVPPPIDMTQYIQSAQQRQQEAKDEARQMAIANTLMSLGTGLVAGDPAAGLQRATQMATETMREGRREAQAEGRMAEQLQLQAAQQERQNIIDTMRFRSEAVNTVANIISGEEKATRETQMQAAQILTNIQMNMDRIGAELSAAGMNRRDVERKLESEARNRATELVLESIKGRVSVEPINPEDLARQVNTLTRQLLDGTDSATPSVGSVTVRYQNKDYTFPTPEAASQFKSKLGI